MESNQGSSNGYWKTMVKMIELKEGTFLDLEDIQEYENSGDHIRAQGKCQGKPRRGI